MDAEVPMRTLIGNGTVVTATDVTEADVVIEGERIIAIAARGLHDEAPNMDTVFLRGEVILQGGAFLGERGAGRYVRAGRTR
jgi:dihydroorotase-like cyclic amidohydrolase